MRPSSLLTNILLRIPLPQICLAAAEGASVEYSGFTWPAGRVLAELLWRRRAALQTRARQAPVTAVELGAGTGLPSVLLALVGGARRIVATDWARAPAEAVLATAVRSGWQPAAAADGVAEVAVALEARRLGWGGTGGLPMNSFELVLGADVFYEPSQYDSVLASACALLRPPPHAAQFLVAYRDRGDLEGVVRAAQGWGFHVQQLDRRRAEEEAEVILLELTLLSIPYD